jgi:hypothetical protein
MPHEPQVGGNAVARLHEDNVADNETFGGNGQSSPVAQDRGLTREHRADGVERLFRSALLNESNRRVDEDDREIRRLLN